MLPALTLSVAEFGSSACPARFCSTQVQVPGSTCITPRAFADETTSLLKPLSCHATAAARDGGTPCRAAIWPICPDVNRVGVGLGDACGTTDGSGCGASGAAGAAPVGSFSAVPICSTAAGSRPFIQASCPTVVPLATAMLESVSPGRTVYPPIGWGGGGGARAGGGGGGGPP